MKILISGSTGLIGSFLVPALRKIGHGVIRLVRRTPRSPVDEVAWNPIAGDLNPSELEGVNAVVHLAGESIAAGRWTPEKKDRIRRSRVEGTRLLAAAISELSRPPGVLVCASAVGYYGNRSDEILSENSPAGIGFLAEVCREWEAAAAPAVESGIRTVALRIGVVLTPAGGVLAKMLPLFRMGLGGKVGSGRQYLSWISMDDLVGVFFHVLTEKSLTGAVNAVSPRPVTNADFARELGHVVKRPALFAVPAAVVRLALGEMAEELLLASARAVPLRLVESGYAFRYPQLEMALRHMLRPS